MLREYISPVVASLAPAGGKPFPYPDKGESDGAAMEPTDITTIQVLAEPQGQPQPAAVAPVETKKSKVKSANPGEPDQEGVAETYDCDQSRGPVYSGHRLPPERLLQRRQGTQAFGIAAVEAEGIKKLNTLPGLSENPSAVGLLKVEEQQVPVATSMVQRRQYRTNRDAVIPIHKMIRELET
ncbi:hypothetical protein DUI87_02747 [Hirundo rustica rustica]|uniref:Uncharacterized protein n=1 Tax=Hirundo rustica rustica TaxID=333673 RepID=A0A3M0LA43_HIRRU|nr:hypothetical protein DUI87_02747 [Hirundo rustica rustica]